MGTGIFLVAFGALLVFAVVDNVRNLNLDAAGWIIIAAGFAQMYNAKRGDRIVKTKTQQEGSEDPDAPAHEVQETVEERHTD